jgi:hypothetical protein
MAPVVEAYQAIRGASFLVAAIFAAETLCKTSRLTGLWFLKWLDEPVE